MSRTNNVVETKEENYPLISIILSCLNSGKTIERTILTITGLDYPNIELIVIDGDSTDGTMDILNKYSDKIDCLITEKDQGVYEAMNKGVRKASGDFIYFIGADDVIVDSWRNLAGRMKPGNTIYYGDVYFPVLNKIYNGKFSKSELLFRNICQQAIFYPASVFRKYSFSEKYPFLADYHLNLILKNDPDFTFKHINLLVAVFSEKGISTNNIDYDFQRDRIQIIRNNYSYFYYLVFFFGMTLKKWLLKKKKKTRRRCLF